MNNTGVISVKFNCFLLRFSHFFCPAKQKLALLAELLQLSIHLAFVGNIFKQLLFLLISTHTEYFSMMLKLAVFDDAQLLISLF